jgi:multidrug efflux pump subunit AcrB
VQLDQEIVVKTGEAINKAGGGITGATAIVIVVAFLALILAFFLLWKAYQKSLKDSKDREAKLIELNIQSQATQRETNEILKEVRQFMGSMDVRMQNLEQRVREERT